MTHIAVIGTGHIGGTLARRWAQAGENFAQPDHGGEAADLFYCGAEDPLARGVVEGLIRDVGLGPIYLGGLDQADVLDGVLRLWFAVAIQQGRGRHTAFKVLSG